LFQTRISIFAFLTLKKLNAKTKARRSPCFYFFNALTYPSGDTPVRFLKTAQKYDSFTKPHLSDTVLTGRVPVVAHIAAVSGQLSAKMARHAESVGCTGVSAVPSYYYKLNPDEMYRYYSEIAAASDLP
jgi:hypothetical protein